MLSRGLSVERIPLGACGKGSVWSSEPEVSPVGSPSSAGSMPLVTWVLLVQPLVSPIPAWGGSREINEPYSLFPFQRADL